MDSLQKELKKLLQDKDLDINSSIFNKIIPPTKSQNKTDEGKIGISNYKPFNKHMQYVSKKPITLIYGPNSIGKSSYIKSSFYLNAVRKKGNTNIISSDEFGDSIDFGGFYNSVHKHNVDERITYKIENADGNKAFGSLFGYTLEDMSSYESTRLNKIETKEENIYYLRLFISYVLSENYFKMPDITFDDENGFRSFSLLNDTKSFYKYIVEYLINNQNEFIKDDKLDFQAIECFDAKAFIEDFNQIKIKDITPNGKHASDILDIATGEDIKLTAIYQLTQESLEVTYEIENKPFLTIETHNDITEFPEIAPAGTSLVPKILFNKSPVKSVQFHKHSLFAKFFSLTTYSDFFKKIDIYDACVDAWKREDEVFSSLDMNFDMNFEQARNADDESISTMFGKNPFFPLCKEEFLNKINKKRNIAEQNIAFINSIINALEKLLIGLEEYTYLGPLRYYPDRYFNLSENKKNLTKSSEDSWKSLLKSYNFDGENFDNEVLEKVNEWLGSKKLKTPYKIEKQKIYDDEMIKKAIEKVSISKNSDMKKIISEIKPINEILVFRDLKNNTRVSHKDLGLGVSQILPILVKLFDSNQKGTLAIEQPELHLHPAIQSELADELIFSSQYRKFLGKSKEQIVYGSPKLHLMIETHSEHLLLRMMKRMKQTVDGTLEDKRLTLTPDDICLLYVDSDGENTFLTELELDDDGSLLDPWPGGFFEEGFNERFF